MTDDALRASQNSHGVHVCPSEAEGFGHSIVEGMSCRALVITTDAPPMNEIVTRERGLLARYTHARPQRWGIAYSIDPAALTEAIDAVLVMPASQRTALGASARSWFEVSDARFRGAIIDVLRPLVRRA